MADADRTVAEMRAVVARFVAEREWEGYHDAKNVSMSVAIEAAELMEHFQWVRSEELGALLADGPTRAQVVDEVADIACYVIALANVLEIDLSDAVAQKVAKNAEKYPVARFRGRYFKPGGER
jgi:NTP pyrophosphatase (non-canonical NTP hydrolase)